MEKNLVSVIMSTKDTEENMLKEAINSILNQTYKNIEFIIVCDGSEENYNYIKKLKDKRIKIIKNVSTIGLTKSLNKGLKIAKGKYIARMDSDDISSKNRLKWQIEYLEKHLNVDICSVIPKNFGYSHNYSINLFPSFDGNKAQLFLYSCLTHAAVVFRKSFLDQFQIKYDENCLLAQDYELWTRCAKLTNMKVIQKVGYYIRVHHKRITTTKKEEQTKVVTMIYKRNLQELGMKPTDKNINTMFFLSGRENLNVNSKNILEFIEEAILKNKEKGIYESKNFRRILYFNYVFRMFTLKKQLVNIKYIFKSHIISLTIKYIITFSLLKMGFYK